MAKDKTKELLYKIEGLKRMCKRKTLRQRKNRIKTIIDIKLLLPEREFDYDY